MYFVKLINKKYAEDEEGKIPSTLFKKQINL